MRVVLFFSMVICAVLLVFGAGCITFPQSSAGGPVVEYPNVVGTPSDYGDSDNWMHLPDAVVYPVDVIYLYPTAYSDANGTRVSEITDAGMRTAAREIYLGQATAFETTGNLFAPYYRQLNGALFSTMTNADILAGGWNEPRTDVYAALDYYFVHYNSGRPYILAGHSQGSNMINIVLDEYMELHPEYYERMIVAYQIGCSLTTDFLMENPHVRAAAGADDLGVVVSWNTEGPGNLYAESLVVDKNAVSINPLNWRTDEMYAGVSENPGSLVETGDGGLIVGAGIADARVNLTRGSVICTSVDPAVYAIPAVDVFGPESYHGYDYGFYFVSLRENAELRASHWLESR
ncbi:MAG: DUF3089 domain-containing protein [Methanocorpusculum sp.]|nr:DUF3089 domain-containing protein [Methanocorpusculum sp.]